MKRTLLVMLAIWLAAPRVADAHLMNTGLGPIYDGLAHLFVSPEDLLPVIAVALLAGLRGPHSARAVLFILPAAWLLGSFAGEWTGIVLCPPPLTAALTFALGALVAADLALPLEVVVVCAAGLGLLHGGVNGAELAAHHGAELTPAGVVVSIFVVVALIAGQVTAIQAATLRIVVRVAGSWIAAIGLFMFGWSMRA